MLAATAKLDSAVSAVEAALYQVRNRSPKDKIAFPIRLNDRLTGLRAQVDAGDAPPTDAQRRIFAQLSAELERERARLAVIYRTTLAETNRVLRSAGLAAVGDTTVQ